MSRRSPHHSALAPSGAATLGVLLVVCFAAAPAVAQSGRATAHIGYLYPAGGRLGSVVQMSIGGQGLRDAIGVQISGVGVRGTVLRHVPPLAGNLQEVLGELERIAREELKGPRGATSVASPAPAALPRMLPDAVQTAPAIPSVPASPPTTEMGADAGPDRKQKQREQVLEHPLIQELLRLEPRELKYVLKEIRDGRKRQANPQIAETVVIQLAIDLTATPGERELRVITRSGLSNPLIMQVGRLPEILEHEPNNPDWPDGPLVTFPAVLNGWLSPGDVDGFRFQARKGQRLVIDASARRLVPFLADAVPGWFQATLGLRDSRGHEVVFSDGCGFAPDPLLLVEIPADDTYRLDVRDALYRGRFDFVYRVSIQERPRALAPASRTASTTAVATTSEAIPVWPGDPREPWHELSYEALRGPGAALVEPGLLDEGLPEHPEEERGDDARPAVRIDVPAVVTGTIGRPGDVDVCSFRAKAGQLLVFDVRARRLWSPLDPLLRVRDSAGRVLALNDDRTAVNVGVLTQHADSFLSWTAPADGDYTVAVSDALGQGGAAYRYRLRISPPRPDFSVFVSPSAVDVLPGPAVPLTVHVVRNEGFTGDVDVEIASGPAGYTLAGARVPAGLSAMRLTLAVPPGPVDPPARLELKARARVGGVMVDRPVIPCDEVTQAFLVHHLVPAAALLVAGRGPRPLTRFVKLNTKGTLEIPVGGVAEVMLQVPRMPMLEDARFELSGGPPGVTLDPVVAVPHGLSRLLALRFRADPKASPGYRDNLLVEVLLEKEAPAAKNKGGGQKRRVSVGFLPAIPFEIRSPAARAASGL